MINDSCHVPLALSAGTCISLLTTDEVVDRVDARLVNGNLRFWRVDSSTELVSGWSVWSAERTGVRGSSITHSPPCHPRVMPLARSLIHAYRAWTTRAPPVASPIASIMGPGALAPEEALEWAERRSAARSRVYSHAYVQVIGLTPRNRRVRTTSTLLGGNLKSTILL